jgi:dephospho-CoA kinase
MAQVFRLGLTGGIGSGKSTVATVLATLGAAVVDADAISREVTAPGGLAINTIRQAFGDDFITGDGALDRDRMRTLAYADTGARQRLEAIIHPLVGQEISRRVTSFTNVGHHCLVFDIPLLVESAHWRKTFDQVLVIDCSIETQIKRVMLRNALKRTAVEAIIATQSSRVDRLRASDIVIFNDNISLETLKQHVYTLAIGFGLSLTHTTASEN